MMSSLLFYVFSAGALFCAFLVVTRRNPFESAMALVATFFLLAADYVLLEAPFVALVQVLVYAGAVVVLFLFVVMLLNLRQEARAPFRKVGPRALLGTVAAVGLGCLAMVLATSAVPSAPFPTVDPSFGTVKEVGLTLFSTRFLVVVELLSTLLTVGLVGAVFLGRKED